MRQRCLLLMMLYDLCVALFIFNGLNTLLLRHHIHSCEGHRLLPHMGDYFFISSQNLIHCFAVQFELENISCCGYCVNYNWEDMALKISVHILHRMEECHVLKTSLRNLGSYSPISMNRMLYRMRFLRLQ
jgi:hypothetical protein